MVGVSGYMGGLGWQERLEIRPLIGWNARGWRSSLMNSRSRNDGLQLNDLSRS
jgi:hypothetical protein